MQIEANTRAQILLHNFWNYFSTVTQVLNWPALYCKTALALSLSPSSLSGLLTELVHRPGSSWLAEQGVDEMRLKTKETAQAVSADSPQQKGCTIYHFMAKIIQMISGIHFIITFIYFSTMVHLMKIKTVFKFTVLWVIPHNPTVSRLHAFVFLLNQVL